MFGRTGFLPVKAEGSTGAASSPSEASSRASPIPPSAMPVCWRNPRRFSKARPCGEMCSAWFIGYCLEARRIGLVQFLELRELRVREERFRLVKVGGPRVLRLALASSADAPLLFTFATASVRTLIASASFVFCSSFRSETTVVTLSTSFCSQPGTGFPLASCAWATGDAKVKAAAAAARARTVNVL